MTTLPAIDPSLSMAQLMQETRPQPQITDHMIFVFGSNERGVHGAGAAKFAHQHKGAVWGRGYGLFGQSFAIPTKDLTIETLPLPKIQEYIGGFRRFAQEHPELQFQVTCLGCGLAGLRDDQVAPAFRKAPANCYFDLKWEPWLDTDAVYWGTF